MEYNLTQRSSYLFYSYTCSSRILSDCLRFSHDVVRCWVTSCWPVQGYIMGTLQVAHTASAKHYSLSSLLLIILDICLNIDLILSTYIQKCLCLHLHQHSLGKLQSVFCQVLLPNQLLGKLSKIKTTKHMEFSICWLTPLPKNT